MQSGKEGENGRDKNRKVKGREEEKVEMAAKSMRCFAMNPRLATLNYHSLQIQGKKPGREPEELLILHAVVRIGENNIKYSKSR